MALLDPSEGQTLRWTFGNLSKQVHATSLALSHDISCWLEVHEGRAIRLHHVCRALCKKYVLNLHVRWQRYAVAVWLCAGASSKPVAMPSAGPTCNI